MDRLRRTPGLDHQGNRLKDGKQHEGKKNRENQSQHVPVGDVIRFKLSDGEKVEMLAVKEESDGMIFCFVDCLAKEYSMNEQNTNEADGMPPTCGKS